MKDQATAFLDKFILCVMSTVTPDGKPEAAYVGYRHNKQFEFLVGTSKLSRKYHNLQHNPHAAIVVASLEGEVQYEGDVKEVNQEEYDQLVASGQFEALPGIDKYRGDPNQVYFKLTPTWMRFIQHAETDQVEEMTEF